MNYIKDVARGLQLRILNGTIMQGENDNRSIREQSNPSCIQIEDISPVYRPKLNHRPIQGEGNNTSVQREHVGCVHQRHITPLYRRKLNNTCIQREGTYTGRHTTSYYSRRDDRYPYRGKVDRRPIQEKGCLPLDRETHNFCLQREAVPHVYRSKIRDLVGASSNHLRIQEEDDHHL